MPEDQELKYQMPKITLSFKGLFILIIYIIIFMLIPIYWLIYESKLWIVDVFWSKAPADDARPLARIINTMINQELYNRQKRNYGQRIYDPSMFPNVAALADWRPDGLIPANTKNGERSVSSGLDELRKKVILDTVIEVSSNINVFDSDHIYKISFNENKLYE